MQDDFDRALALATHGAPLEAQAMALLLGWQSSGHRRERDVGRFLAFSKYVADPKVTKPYPMLPEIQGLIGLDLALPEWLQTPALRCRGPAPRPPVAVADSTSPMVDRTVEAITPWLTSSLPFAQALVLADDPQHWCRATPQMTVLKYVRLENNGSLWRGRLTKQTDFGKPLVTGLVTEETIEITAEGSDGQDGSGHRRYNFVLVSARNGPIDPPSYRGGPTQGPNLLKLVEDVGWIEMSGDADGTQLRIQKRAAISRPVVDDFAGQ